MSSNLGFSNQPRMSLNAFRIKKWIFIILSAFSYAQGPPTTELNLPLRNRVASTPVSTESQDPWLPRIGDTAVFSGRDLSPDIIATSVPVSALPSKGNANPHLDEKNLILRSSSHNISGIGEYLLFALPIFSTDLMELLSKTQVDMRTRVSDDFVSSYQYNTTKWSFSVIMANTTLRYASLQAVVTRFLRLSSTTAAPGDIVSTRVGVILNSSIPIADIIILPCQIVRNSSFVPFSNFGHSKNLSVAHPVEIVKVTPFGSSCAYQFVNETTALAPFQGHDVLIEKNITTRSLETEILARVGQTAFVMSIYLWHREDGLPVQVKVWALKALLQLALCQILVAAFVTYNDKELSFLLGDLYSNRTLDQGGGLDTDFYALGRLLGRFVLRLTQRTTSFSLRICMEIIKTLLTPLQAMSARADAWAIEGEIYGPRNGTDEGDNAEGEENSKKTIIAKWQIWIGDHDEQDP